MEILITGLAERVDGSLLDANDPNRWRALPYRAEGFDGVMLACGEGDRPSSLTVRLGVTGRYDIHLGGFGFISFWRLRARLSGDRCCKVFDPPPLACISEPVLHEFHFGQAELTGQDLILEPPYLSSLHAYPAALAYIRLTPVSDPPPPSKPKVQYPLVFTNDGDGIFGEFPHRRQEDLLESFERIGPDSCVRMLLWGNGDADSCNYPTRVGQYAGGKGRYWSHFMQVKCNNLALWKRNGWDSLKVVRDYAKQRGWEFQVYIRMEAFRGLYPFDWIRSEFFESHPECHCRDAQGRRVDRLSYAYPQVQDHMLALVSEIAEYEPDGVCFAFNRGVPVMLYEPIMVEGFKAAYGLDPRELDERDPRWADYQARVFTPFMEKAKSVLKPGQRLSAIVLGNEADCRRWGLDVADWVARGVIDDLFPVGQKFTPQDVHIDGPECLDFDYFNALAGRTNVRLYPMLYPWALFQSDRAKWTAMLRSYLADGADGYAVWDANEGDRFAGANAVGLEPGTPTEAAKPEVRTVKLLELEGFRFDRYHYFEAI